MRRIAAMLAGASALVLLIPGTAAADTDVLTHTHGGYAMWYENGDTIEVCDSAGDGRGTRGYIYRPYADEPQNGGVLIKASDPKADGNCTVVAENISETVAISIKVCNYKGDWVGNCGWTRIPR